jgi:hypothetical protein
MAVQRIILNEILVNSNHSFDRRHNNVMKIMYNLWELYGDEKISFIMDREKKVIHNGSSMFTILRYITGK